MYGNGTVLFEPLLDDDMFELTQAQCLDKIRACIYHFERLLGVEEGIWCVLKEHLWEGGVKYERYRKNLWKIYSTLVW